MQLEIGIANACLDGLFCFLGLFPFNFRRRNRPSPRVNKAVVPVLCNFPKLRTENSKSNEAKDTSKNVRKRRHT